MAKHSICPWKTNQQLKPVVRLLQQWRGDVRNNPEKSTRHWDNFRSLFGKSKNPPNGVSVDNDGMPDIDGVMELIKRSSILSDDASYSLGKMVKSHNKRMDDLEEQLSKSLNYLTPLAGPTHKRARSERSRKLTKWRKDLRNAIDSAPKLRRDIVIWYKHIEQSKPQLLMHPINRSRIDAIGLQRELDCLRHTK